MKKLIVGETVHGPFNSVKVLDDRYHCDGIDFPFNVLGNCQVVELDLPDGFVASLYEWVDGSLREIERPAAESEIISFLLKVNQEADEIYSLAIGNRAAEYAAALSDAMSYRNSGYGGEVPDSVKVWAAITGNTFAWAADDVISASESWAASQLAIRHSRLAAKQAARTAQSQSDLIAAQQEWNVALAAIREKLSLIV